MRTPIVITIFVLLAIALFGWYLTSNKSINNPANVVVNPSITTLPTEPTTTNSLDQGGSSYLDSSGIYSFLYPTDFKIDYQNNRKTTRIYKQGPSQKGQTEMYDGVIMTFETIDLGEKSLDSYTTDYIKTQTSDGTSEVTSPKNLTTLNGYPAYTFNIRGLGEYSFYTVHKDASSQNAVLITYMVTDPTNQGFQHQVDEVLQSFKLFK